jgi:hypothetical protein
MRLRLLTAAFLVAFMSAFVLAPMGAAAAPKTATPVPVTGTVTDAVGQTGMFTGTISNLATSVNAAGQLVLSGVLNGTTLIGGVSQTISSTFSTLLTPAVNSACTILTLDLGPIFLDVLGLQIDLSEINLNITAVPGAGNLLGNLLCAVAGLLDGGPLTGISGLLNNLLRQLGLA